MLNSIKSGSIVCIIFLEDFNIEINTNDQQSSGNISNTYRQTRFRVIAVSKDYPTPYFSKSHFFFNAEGKYRAQALCESVDHISLTWNIHIL